MSGLSHIDKHGNARMVDVGDKPDTLRIARAEAFVSMKPETLHLIVTGAHKKGDVLTVARIAGIQAAKRCAELIPLCHQLNASGINVELTPDEVSRRVHITTEVRVSGPTGVEMEALTAAAVAALTVYDMCKAVDRGMVIQDIRLLHKSGGQSGEWHAEGDS